MIASLTGSMYYNIGVRNITQVTQPLAQCAMHNNAAVKEASLSIGRVSKKNDLEGPVRIHDSGMLHKKSIFQEN